jgi:DNA-binding NtrC family response regulator
MTNRVIRVLHVDDLEEEFILARELLASVEDVDFEFQWVPDIKTATQAINTLKFDVCLVDYYLGIDRGLDFINTAIANGITIPFILMSGQKDRSIEREALKLGVRQCIDKNNITASDLLEAIQKAIRN